MKVFNEIKAEVSGTVERILVQNQQAVEFGQPLMLVRPQELTVSADPANGQTDACFHALLIANRGEIALRIIRACKELGIQTVCVFSEDDRDAIYLHLADRAICIGPGPAAESYLNIDRIIAAAEVANVEAIHPGYGFLAENPQFADVCRDCKIEFIGPSAESMRLLGDKIEAKKLAKKAKVPNIPWTEGPVENDEEAAKWAAEVGYPVMIKAAAGGGGRGIRLVHNEATLRHALPAAQAEAEAPSRTPPSTWKSASRTPATSRCRSWATGRATSCTSTSATAACSGGTRS